MGEGQQEWTGLRGRSRRRRGRGSRAMRRFAVKKTILWGGLIAAAVYLFDPREGRARRERLQEKLGALGK